MEVRHGAGSIGIVPASLRTIAGSCRKKVRQGRTSGKSRVGSADVEVKKDEESPIRDLLLAMPNNAETEILRLSVDRCLSHG